MTRSRPSSGGDRPDDHQGRCAGSVCASSWPGGATLCAGGLTYTFEVSNSGIVDASNVIVRDPIPSGLVRRRPIRPAVQRDVDRRHHLQPRDHPGRRVGDDLDHHAGPLDDRPDLEHRDGRSVQRGVRVRRDEQPRHGDGPGLDRYRPDPRQVRRGAGVAGRLDPIATNGTETYVIQSRQHRDQDASGIRVRDTLPSGTRSSRRPRRTASPVRHDGAATGGVVEVHRSSILGTASEVYLGQGGSRRDHDQGLRPA